MWENVPVSPSAERFPDEAVHVRVWARLFPRSMETPVHSCGRVARNDHRSGTEQSAVEAGDVGCRLPIYTRAPHYSSVLAIAMGNLPAVIRGGKEYEGIGYAPCMWFGVIQLGFQRGARPYE